MSSTTTVNELHEVPNPTKSETESGAVIRSKWIARGIGAIVLVSAAVAGTTFWLDSRHFESTDDAQVDGHFAALSTRIDGTVVWVDPNAENDHSVKAGDLLLQLDPRDFQVVLERAKALLFASMSIVALAMFVYSSMNLDTNASHYRWERMLQASGYGLFLVPVNIIAYSQLRPDQNNKSSSLTNLFRNWGGSFGIAFITTAAERRANFHQLNLGANLVNSSQSLLQSTQGIASHLMQYGFSAADAGPASLGVVYQQLLRQSLFLGFMDCFRVIGWLTLAMIPVVVLVRKFKGGGSAPAGH